MVPILGPTSGWRPLHVGVSGSAVLSRKKRDEPFPCQLGLHVKGAVPDNAQEANFYETVERTTRCLRAHVKSCARFTYAQADLAVVVAIVALSNFEEEGALGRTETSPSGRMQQEVRQPQMAVALYAASGLIDPSTTARATSLGPRVHGLSGLRRLSLLGFPLLDRSHWPCRDALGKLHWRGKLSLLHPKPDRALADGNTLGEVPDSDEARLRTD